MTYIGCYNSTGTHPHSLRPPHGTQVRKHNYSPLSKCLLLVLTIVILEYLNFINSVRAWYPIYCGLAGTGRCIGCVPFTGGIPLLHKEPRSLHFFPLIIDINMVKIDSSQSSDFKTYVQN